MDSRRKYMKGVIDDALNGDSNAFAILYASSYTDLYTRAARVLDNDNDIHDILYGTYTAAFTRLEDLRNPLRFYKWIKIICRGRLHTFLTEKGMAEEDVRRALNKGRFGDNNVRSNPSVEKSGELLEHVLRDLGYEPNTVPLDTLVGYHKERFVSRAPFYIVLAILLIVLLIIIFFMFKPSIELTKDEANSTPHQVVYFARTESVLPITHVISHFNNDVIEISHLEGDLYSVTVEENGNLDVTCRALNRRTATDSVEITEIDKIDPVVEDYYLAGDTFVIMVSDEGYGVDYGSFELVNNSDLKKYEVISYDEGSGKVVLPYTHEPMSLSFSDLAGNTITFAVTPS